MYPCRLLCCHATVALEQEPLQGLIDVAKPFFRPEVLQHQQQRLAGTVHLTRPVPLVYLTALLLLVVTSAVVYLSSAQYSRKQTVQGVLQPSAGAVRLQLAESGSIRELLVQEGQTVQAGQPILRLDKQQFDASQNELSSTLLTQNQQVLTQLQTDRAQKLKQHQLQLQQQQDKIASLKRDLQELQNQQQTLANRLNLNREQLAQLNKLQGSGYISQLEITKQKDALLQLEQQQQQQQAAALKLKADISQAEQQLQQLPLSQQAELSSIDNQIAGQTATQAQLSVQQSSTLVAPSDGRVSALQVKAGQWHAQGQAVLTLLPLHSDLEAILYVPTSAVGFLTVGQTARLRYDAYPYQRFGVFAGEVIEISDSVLLPTDVSDFPLTGPSFRVRVKVPAQQLQAYNRNLPLKAGMTLQADLITERQSLLQWLFDPIYSMKGTW